MWRVQAARRMPGGNSSRIPSSQALDWDFVAHEIEAAVFGESDEEGWSNDKSQNLGMDRLVNPANIRTRNNPHRRKRTRIFRSRGRKRRLQTTSLPASAAVSRDRDLLYDLFDEQQIPERRSVHRSRSHEHISPSATTREGASSVVIYAQKYCLSNVSLLGNISTVLSIIFILLLMIRIISNLAAAVTGKTFFLFLFCHIMQALLSRPMQMIHILHSSPIVVCGCIGAVVGSLYPLWEQEDQLSSSLRFTGAYNLFLARKSHGNQPSLNGDVIKGENNDNDRTYMDLLMVWGILRGFFYGIEIGSVWLITFGDFSYPTLLTRTFLRRVWEPTKQRGQEVMKKLQQNSSFVPHAPEDMKQKCRPSRLDTAAENQQKCAICLDVLDDNIVEGNDMETMGMFNVRCRLLPCMHSFHCECAIRWLTVQHNCPVCRIPVQSMQSCD